MKSYTNCLTSQELSSTIWAQLERKITLKKRKHNRWNKALEGLNWNARQQSLTLRVYFVPPTFFKMNFLEDEIASAMSTNWQFYHF